MQLTGQNLHNEHAKCDIRGDTNFKGSDSSDPTVYSLYRVSQKKTDAFHIQISRELIAGICLFPCGHPT